MLLLAVLIALTLPAGRAQMSDPVTTGSLSPLDALTAELLDYNQQLEAALAEEARLNAGSQQLQGFRRDAMVALGHLAGQPITWSGEVVSPESLHSQALVRFMRDSLGHSIANTQSQLDALDATRANVALLHAEVEKRRAALALEGRSDPTDDSPTRAPAVDTGTGRSVTRSEDENQTLSLRGGVPIPIASFPDQQALSEGARPLIMPLKQPWLLFGFHEDDPGDRGRLFHKGLRLGSEPGGIVYAPYDGKVMFAAPYRGFGNLLVIEHEGGGATLLSGLHSFAISVGDWVKQRTPVGVMDPDPAGRHRLNFEFRVNQVPVDPLTLIGPIVDE
jgi:murein DD-endopeptidase MepM/ murein hydrolase activator NlpD